MSKRSIVFAIAFFYSLQIASLSYLNSTLLSQHYSSRVVSVLYFVASALSLFVASRAPRLMKKIGVINTAYCALGISIVFLTSIGHVAGGYTLALAFVGYFALISTGYSVLDVVLEHYSPPAQTGAIRGVYLTVTNSAWVIGMILNGIVLKTHAIEIVYSIGSIFLCLCILLLSRLGHVFHKKKHAEFNIRHALHTIITHVRFRRIFLCALILQIFFATMVIYSPLYLGQFVPLRSMTILFGIMLLPFVLFQYIGGKICDHLHYEKRFIVFGFIIMAMATIVFISLPWTTPLFLFGLVLFVSRTGAAIAEVAIESAFFRRVTDEDTAIVSIYRSIIPFSYIIVPLCALLLFSSYGIMFCILAVVLSSTSLFIAHHQL